MEGLTVGQMAKLNHISEQTLRLYDNLGLLHPSRRGAENGYRYYDIRQSAQLDIIQYMKSLGMNLREIKLQLDSKNLRGIDSILREKQVRIEEEIRALKTKRRALERTVESFERYRSAPPDGTILLEYIGSRLMYRVDAGINVYDHGLDTSEEMLRDLKDSLVKNRLPQIYFCNAGTILSRENLLAERFWSTEVFVFVDREFVPEGYTVPVPAANYLCIYCDNFYKEREYACRLLEKIREEGYEVSGDYLCEAVADIPVAGPRERGMFLRLQVPVRFH